MPDSQQIWQAIDALRAQSQTQAVAQARTEGQFNLIAEQMDRVEGATTEIKGQLKELNGRTLKSEKAIEAIQVGAEIQRRGHVRAEDSPRASLAAYSKKQKTAAVGGGVLIVLGAFDFLKEATTVVMTILKRGGP
jgi:hypothetical protein